MSKTKKSTPYQSGIEIEAKHSISLFKKYIFHKVFILDNCPTELRSMWKEVITMMQVAVLFYEEKGKIVTFLLKNINSFLLENEMMPLDKPISHSISMPEFNFQHHAPQNSMSDGEESNSELKHGNAKRSRKNRKGHSVHASMEDIASACSSSPSFSSTKGMKRSISNATIRKSVSYLTIHNKQLLPTIEDIENGHFYKTWKEFALEKESDGLHDPSDQKKKKKKEKRGEDDEKRKSPSSSSAVDVGGDDDGDDDDRDSSSSSTSGSLSLGWLSKVFFNQKKKKRASNLVETLKSQNEQDILSSYRYRMRRNAICLYHNEKSNKKI